MVALRTGSKLRLPSGDPRPLQGHPSSLFWGMAELNFQHSWKSETAVKVLSPCLPQPAPLRQGPVPGNRVPVSEEPDWQTHMGGGGRHTAPISWHTADVMVGVCVPHLMLQAGIEGQHQLERMASVASLSLRFLFCKVGEMMTPTLEGCYKVSNTVAARPGRGGDE